jgi:hypothetical protein
VKAREGERRGEKERCLLHVLKKLKSAMKTKEVVRILETV